MQNFSWTDVIIGIILFRGFVVAQKGNLLGELIKFIGVILATFISIHYYLNLSIFTSEKIFIPAAFSKSVAFSVIALITVFVFYLIKEGWLLILKFEISDKIDKWGGFIFVMLRYYIVCALVYLGILLCDYGNISYNTYYSLSGKVFKSVAVNIYQIGFYGIISKISPNEPVNEEVINLTKKKPERKKLELPEAPTE